MSLTACILASGSKGNCIYISSETTAILIDAGLSGRATEQRLTAIGVSPDSIRAICLSHEHDDHVRGVARLRKRYDAAIYANGGTIDAMKRNPKCRALEWNVFSTGMPFRIGDLEIDTFSVPHDAYEPVGFVVSGGGTRIGVATDLGVPTTLVKERLRACQMVIVEANHDERLLMETPRPWTLKQRIRGRQGHLSNDLAATLLEAIAGPELEAVYLAHLSEECNREELAVRAVSDRLAQAGRGNVRVGVGYPDRVSEVWRASPA